MCIQHASTSLIEFITRFTLDHIPLSFKYLCGILYVVHYLLNCLIFHFRYSLENPLAYIHSNVECQLALLNVLRDFPVSIALFIRDTTDIFLTNKYKKSPFEKSLNLAMP